MLLVTGAAGKVGQAFLRRFSVSESHAHWRVRAFCHSRPVAADSRTEVLFGNLSSRDDVSRACRGITHVLHLATCKETPDDIMDVAIKGFFWLLEECRRLEGFQRVVLVGGDAAIGHFFYPRSEPLVESGPFAAYPGCYALSKVLEETMLQQYRIQYGMDTCCLRAPWIMEKDDFRASLSFGDDVFGGPRWRDLVGEEPADRYREEGRVPVLCDFEGKPVKRNFVHVDDLAEAILIALGHPSAAGETFHIGMDEPVDYREMADHLLQTRGLPSVDVRTPYHSTWLDNSKAKFLLGWRPRYGMRELVDAAWDYRRSPEDPRKVVYPG